MRFPISIRKAVAGSVVAASLWTPSAFGQQPTPVREPLLFNHQATTEPAEDPEIAFEPSIGGVEQVTERYPTGEIRVQRQVRLDDEHNYVNHGPWKMFDRKGNVVANGGYDMGKRTGIWTRWHGRGGSKEMTGYPFNRFKPPFVSTVSYTNGVMDGLWMILDSDEKKVRQVSIENGKRHGVTVTWLPSGEVLRQATYENGKPVGEVLELKKPGAEMTTIATYINGRRVIEKTNFFPRTRTKRSEERYLDKQTVQTKPDSFWDATFAEFSQTGETVLHGITETWHANGQQESKGEYRNGEKVGRFTYWHANGQKRAEGVYRNDKHEGPWVWWHDNGLKSAFGTYTAGTERGQWYWWHADGRLERKQLFDGTETRSARKSQSQQSR